MTCLELLYDAGMAESRTCKLLVVSSNAETLHVYAALDKSFS